MIPWFEISLGMPSDWGSHFIAEVVLQMSKILGTSWDLHTPYRPQLSGMVKKVTQNSIGENMSGNAYDLGTGSTSCFGENKGTI